MRLSDLKGKLDELRQKRQAVLTEAQAAIPQEEGVEPTAEQRKLFGEKMADAEKYHGQELAVEKDVKALESLENQTRELGASRGTVIGAQGTQAPERTRGGHEMRVLPYGHTHAFPDTEDGHRQAYEVGMWLRTAVINDQVTSAFPRLGRAREEARAWLNEYGTETRRMEQRAAMSASVNADGGALSPETFAATLIRLVEEYGVVRRVCKSEGMIWPMKGDTMRVPRRKLGSGNGLTYYYVGDTDQITASKPSLDIVNLVAKKGAMLTLIPTSLMEDSPIDVAEFITREMAWSQALAEDSAAFLGDGTSTYGGMLGFATTLASGFVGRCTTASGIDTTPEVTASDLANCYGVLPQAADARARWYCHKSFWAQVFQRLGMAAGGAQMQEVAGYKMKTYGGYPIEIVQALTALTITTDTSDKYMAYFGDLASAVVFGDRREFTVRQSDQRYFEYDQIGVLSTARFDINAANVGDASYAGWLVGMYGN